MKIFHVTHTKRSKMISYFFYLFRFFSERRFYLLFSLQKTGVSSRCVRSRRWSHGCGCCGIRLRGGNRIDSHKIRCFPHTWWYVVALWRPRFHRSRLIVLGARELHDVVFHEGVDAGRSVRRLDADEEIPIGFDVGNARIRKRRRIQLARWLLWARCWVIWVEFETLSSFIRWSFITTDAFDCKKILMENAGLIFLRGR